MFIQREHGIVSPKITELLQEVLWKSLASVAVVGVLIPVLWGWLIWMLHRGEGVAHA